MRVFHLTRLVLADAGEEASAGVGAARHEVAPRHRVTATSWVFFKDQRAFEKWGRLSGDAVTR